MPSKFFSAGYVRKMLPKWSAQTQAKPPLDPLTDQELLRWSRYAADLRARLWTFARIHAALATHMGARLDGEYMTVMLVAAGRYWLTSDARTQLLTQMEWEYEQTRTEAPDVARHLLKDMAQLAGLISTGGNNPGVRLPLTGAARQLADTRMQNWAARNQATLPAVPAPPSSADPRIVTLPLRSDTRTPLDIPRPDIVISKEGEVLGGQDWLDGS